MDQNPASPAAAPVPAEPNPVLKTALEVDHKINIEGLPQTQVAAEYHKSLKWVRDMLAVAKLPPESRKALEAGRGYGNLIKSANARHQGGNAPIPMGTAIPTPHGDMGNGGTEVMGMDGDAKEHGISGVPANGNAPIPMGTAIPTPHGDMRNGGPEARGTEGNAKERVNLGGAPPKAAKGSAPIGNTPMGVVSDNSGYPLLRDSLNHFEEVCVFWRKAAEPKLGGLAERWLLYFGGKGWLRVGLVALILGLAGYGGWQAVHNIRAHTAGFWWRFQTAYHQSGSGSAAPHIFDSHIVGNHHLELKWTAVAGALKYRVYWHSSDDKDIHPLGEDVDSLGAVVDVHPLRKEGYISVKGIGPGNIPSPESEKIAFVTNGENYLDTVEPLPPSEQGEPPKAANQNGGTAVTAGPRRNGGAAVTAGPPQRQGPAATAASAVAAAPLVNSNDVTQAIQAGIPQNGGIATRLGTALAVIAGKTVTATGSSAARLPACGARNIRWHKEPSPGHPRSILVEWDDTNASDQVNLFAARFSQSQSFDRDGTLIRGHSVYWWPPDQGEQVFLLYLTTVNSQGDESAPSPRMLVDLR